MQGQVPAPSPTGPPRSARAADEHVFPDVPAPISSPHHMPSPPSTSGQDDAPSDVQSSTQEDEKRKTPPKEEVKIHSPSFSWARQMLQQMPPPKVVPSNENRFHKQLHPSPASLASFVTPNAVSPPPTTVSGQSIPSSESKSPPESALIKVSDFANATHWPLSTTMSETPLPPDLDFDTLQTYLDTALRSADQLTALERRKGKAFADFFLSHCQKAFILAVRDPNSPISSLLASLFSGHFNSILTQQQDLTAQLTQLEARIKELDRQKSKLQVPLEALTTAETEPRAEPPENPNDKALRKVQAQLEGEKQKNTSLQVKCQRLERQRDALDEELKGATAHKRQLQRKERDNEKEVRKLQQELTQLRIVSFDPLVDEQANPEAKEASNRERTASTNELLGRVNDLYAEVDAAFSAIQQREDELSDLKTTLQSDTSDRQLAERQVALLKKQLTDSLNHQKQTWSDLDALKAENKTLKANQARSAEQWGEERELAEKRIKILEDTIAQGRSQVEALLQSDTTHLGIIGQSSEGGLESRTHQHHSLPPEVRSHGHVHDEEEDSDEEKGGEKEEAASKKEETSDERDYSNKRKMEPSDATSIRQQDARQQKKQMKEEEAVRKHNKVTSPRNQAVHLSPEAQVNVGTTPEEVDQKVDHLLPELAEWEKQAEELMAKYSFHNGVGGGPYGLDGMETDENESRLTDVTERNVPTRVQKLQNRILLYRRLLIFSQSSRAAEMRHAFGVFQSAIHDTVMTSEVARQRVVKQEVEIATLEAETRKLKSTLKRMQLQQEMIMRAQMYAFDHRPHNASASGASMSDDEEESEEDHVGSPFSRAADTRQVPFSMTPQFDSTPATQPGSSLRLPSTVETSVSPSALPSPYQTTPVLSATALGAPSMPQKKRVSRQRAPAPPVKLQLEGEAEERGQALQSAFEREWHEEGLGRGHGSTTVTSNASSPAASTRS